MRRQRVEQRPIGVGADVPVTPRRSVIVGGKPHLGRDMLEHIWPEGGLKRGDDLAYDELCNTLYRNGVASVRNEDALRDVWAVICRSHRSLTRAATYVYAVHHMVTQHRYLSQ